MTNPTTPNPPNTPLWKGGPAIAPEWWRFFFNLNQSTGDAAAGEVEAGAGLAGGGVVADGVTLSIADNGVSNAMLAQAPACSVKGRYANSSGNVGDIAAVTDGSVLTRTDNQLGFTPYLDGIGIGLFNAAPLVNTDALVVASDPPASAAATGTAGTITWDSGFLYVCIATDTWVRVALATWP